MRILLATAPLVAALVACDPYSPDLGDKPFHCGTVEPRCPEGYTCVGDGATATCELHGEPPADAAAPADALPFQCAADSQENGGRNDVPERATPIPSNRPDFQLLVSLCPANDIDFYGFHIDAEGTHFRATVTTDASRGPIELMLLTAGANATQIAVGQQLPDAHNKFEIKLPNRLAAGSYLVKVRSPTLIENNYDLELKRCTGDPVCLD